MSDIKNTMKNALKCSARFIGKTANTAVQATKFKVNEVSAKNKRREMVTALGEKVFALASEGAAVPAELNELIGQIKAVNENIDALRADYAAKKAANAHKYAAEKSAQNAAAQIQETDNAEGESREGNAEGATEASVAYTEEPLQNA